MASRVNVKFVVLLSIAVGVVFLGVAGALAYVKLRSGDRYARLAEAALAQGDIDTADKFYERAVGKERTNVAWLKAWRDVRARKVPDTQSNFLNDYRMYAGILRTIAITMKTDVEAHRDYLDSILERCTGGAGTRESWEELISETENALRYFEPEAPPALRRYRGIAVAVLMDVGAEVENERRETGRRDLEAAVQADPKDLEAAAHLAIWHRVMARSARAAQNDAAAAAALAESDRVIDQMVAVAPNEPYVQVVKVLQEAERATAAAAAEKDPREAARKRVAALDSLKPRLREVQATLMGADPASLTRRTIRSWCFQLAPQIDPKEGLDLALAVLERALSARATDPELLAMRAQLKTMKGDLDGAIAEYEHIASLPNPAVGWDGLRIWDLRQRAVFHRADIAVRSVLMQQDPKAREAALARARELRQALARQVAEGSPEMKVIDGKLKYIEGDLRGAQRLFAEYVKAPGDLPDQLFEVLIFLGEIGGRTGQPGLARESLARASQLRPNSVELLLALARLEHQLQDLKAAEDYYRQILAMIPDHTEARQGLELVLASRGQDVKLEDPVLRVIAEADRVARGDKDTLGDERKALRILENALEPNNYDQRLVTAVVQLNLALGNREAAQAALEKAVAKRPDDQVLSQQLSRLKATATLEGTIDVINSLQVSDLDKCMLRYGEYMRHNRQQDADRELAEAARLAPEDPRVLEQQFVKALSANDLAAATRLAETAAKVDADRAEGDLFKARLQIAQRNVRDAVITLHRVADRGNATPGVYRLLGMAQMQLGRTPDAVDSLRRGLELDPTDLDIIKSLIGVLLQSDRTREALDVARASEPVARRDAEFFNLWLTLEANAGNQTFARTRREQRLAQNPDDLANKASLAQLYIDQKAWAQARTLIDQLRQADPASNAYAAIDARWYAERADTAHARQVFEDHIAALRASGKPLTPEPYLAYANFMLGYQMRAEALAAIAEAEKVQDPKTMAVTIILGSTQLQMGRFTDAQESFRKVLQAGVPDPNHQVRKQLIDALVQGQKFAEAEREFEALGEGAMADVELICLRAHVARGMGDRARAADLLNQAVSRFPEEPLPYLHRARLVMADPALAQDALADLDTAIRLHPGYWQALHTRYTLNLALGRIEDGIRDLRAAVDHNPSNDRLRLKLIDLLLAADRELDAADVADAALKARPGDFRLMQALGDAFARNKRLARAANYYGQAFEQVGDEATALPYLTMLLASTPPNLSQAESALARMGARVAQSWPLLITRSLLRRQQGSIDKARADASDALALVQDAGSLMGWYDRFRAVFPDPAQAAPILRTMSVKAPLQPWLAYCQARCLIDNPATRSEGLAALQSLINAANETGFKLDLIRAISAVYLSESPEEALKACKQGLELAPDDVMLNNNAAYILSESLKRPQEALPYAEKAAAAAPESDGVLDTLASVQWALGQKDRAIETMGRALRVARADAERATWALKLARWKLETGDRAGASVLADLLGEILIDNPPLHQKWKAEYEQLKTDLQSAPK